MKRSVMLLMSIGLLALAGCAGASAAAAAPPSVSVGNAEPTYTQNIQPVFAQVCGACHGTLKIAGLDLTTYQGALRGGVDGPVIVPGSPDSSELVRLQREGHHVRLSEEELELVIEWISDGAPE